MLRRAIFKMSAYTPSSRDRQIVSQHHKGQSHSSPLTMTMAAEPPHIDILKLGVSIWNHWRVSEPLTRPNLRNANLSHLELENANLTGANLRGAVLDGAYLYDADFQGADLRGASLERTVLIGANFHKANLSGASLKRAYLASSDLSNANLTGACLQSSDLQLALLTETRLTRAQVKEADMTACYDLTELQLQQTQDGHLAYLELSDTGVDPKLPAAAAAAVEPTTVATVTLSPTSMVSLSTDAKLASSFQSEDVYSHPIESLQSVREPSLTRAIARKIVKK